MKVSKIHWLLLIAGLLIPLMSVLATDDRGRSRDQDAGKRVALVIGNGAYVGEYLGPLRNPVNDADDIAKALKGFNFEVMVHKNLNKRDMKKAIAEFGRKAVEADATLFYFAGHGLQIKSQNYLMPIDASAESEALVADEGVNVNLVLEEVENAKSAINMVILDACRNNVFSGKFREGSTRGLAPPSGFPKGTVIVYATNPGNVAADGEGRNGLFTAGLLTGFKAKDLSLGNVLLTASTYVEEKSEGRQTPYVNGPETVKNKFNFRIKKEEVVILTSTGIEFVRVPGGTFQMGCGSWQSDCSSDEKPVHEVRVGEFEMGKYEVTQGQWQAVMGANPSGFTSCGDQCPVEKVSWDDVQGFISRLNGRRDGCTYRLPTEAEWEYACRSGGREEKYCGGGNVDQVAWYSENSGGKTHPVGQKSANGLGLHDMGGNVWEWVSDRDDGKFYANSPRDNPQGPSSGSDRVDRGGGWGSYPADVRSAFRNIDDPGYRYDDLGFRLSRTCP
ncbi:MAG: hypothetical protein HW380_200 [Magnetococcales bacterium]|nr:hypothetical protein [Magnetococcales bacterium]HIJ83410.1 SUMF1/EgtB/PvdO family nonheme iron enzyme [Magnetococcales bacterium]